MRIDRIALEEFRRFRDRFELAGLQAGLNIFVGPNEAGKSTLTAALRAVFLERSKTRTVADLAPWGMSNARPSVEVDFHIGDEAYRLRKTFLNRSRCELVVNGASGTRRLEGEAAEDALARLLGFDFPGKGQSKPEHGGIPGLLWIQQGESQQFEDAAQHAGGHLRDALTQVSGELAAGDGDRLFERVVAERGALLDVRFGRPKGIFKEAEDALGQAQAEHAELGREQAALDADVDQLARLRSEQERAQREPPWLVHEQKAAQARTRFTAMLREREALDMRQRELKQSADTLALLQEQVGRDQRDIDELHTLEGQAERVRAGLAEAAASLDRASAARTAAQSGLQEARQRLEASRVRGERHDLDAQIARLADDLSRLGRSVGQAEALAARVVVLQAEAMASEVSESHINELRLLEQQLSRQRAQQEAVATRLAYRLDAGRRIRLDGAEVAGAGEVRLTNEATIELPGIGQLRILPGGQDLSALLAEAQAQAAQRDRLLQRIGVDSAAAAEERWLAHERAGRELLAARKELAIHAPDGIDQLRTALDQASLRRTQLLGRRAALPRVGAPDADGRAAAGSGASADGSLPVAPDAVTAGLADDAPGDELQHDAGDDAPEHDAPDTADDLADAAERAGAAEHAVELATGALAACHAALANESAKLQLLESQLAARRAQYAAPERVLQREVRGARLIEERSSYEVRQAELRDARVALAALQPEMLEQDVLRFEKSATIARDEQQARLAALHLLQGRLEQAGAQGVGERLAEAQAGVERLQRRRDELAARAAALDLLHRLLSEQREAATQRLQAPLARRLNHYLRLLFPAAELRLDDALTPIGLQRGDAEDTLRGLSFGTREQLGILARLAYADLLQEAGRPTLIVLDDALVHTDDTRREFMKRALFDAASRHQILMFTCHGEAWRDMGVEHRSW